MMFSCATFVSGENEDIIYGDVNCDEAINLIDVSLIMKYIAKWDLSDKTFIEDASDVTHDEKIDLFDVSKILKYLADWPLWHK